MSRISLRHLTKKFGQVTAVDNVDLDVKDSEFVVLLGPSGCGKTTTLARAIFNGVYLVGRKWTRLNFFV